ncbi:galactose-1-phosphate uridylyltransferase [candidate division KSB1 bacterium]
MPELRKDPILGRWIIISTERASRPSDFVSQERKIHKGTCPFCSGNEGMTPPEINHTLRETNTQPNKPGWRVRVVPNKYPALRIEGDLNKKGYGIYDHMNGIGAHEVIIESEEHVVSLGSLGKDRVSEVISIYKSRLLDLKLDPRFTFGMLFKNVGEKAGASVEHTHSQLIVLPTVPKLIKEEMDGAEFFYNYRGRCLFCDIIRQEISDEERIVLKNEKFIAFCPFASRFPFETWILPIKHESHFEFIQQQDIPYLSDILLSFIKKLEDVLEYPPYNYMIHTTPFNDGSPEFFHWHIEIIPRLTRVAGFEWGTDFYINPVPPESAAEYLRNSKK